MASTADADQDVLEQYSALLDKLTATPYRLELHQEHLDLTTKMGDPDGLESARDMMATYFPLSEGAWLEWIASRKDKLAHAPEDDMTAYVELTELYQRAIKDYLSIPLLISYSEFFITNYYKAQGYSAPPLEVEDEDEVMEEAQRKVGEPDLVLGAVFGLEAVRAVCDEVLAVGGGHLVESHLLWNVWRNFELDLQTINPSPEQLESIEKLYLNRLAVPHLEIDNVFSLYSSFVTKYFNDTYGDRLPAANKIYSVSRKLMDEREVEEAKLKKHAYAEWAYLEYIKWESSIKRPNAKMVQGLCERAVKDYPSSVDVWETYLDAASATPKKSNLLEVADRAVKNVPQSGLLWSIYMRVVEKSEEARDAEPIFARAIETTLFDKNIDELVILYEARAGFHRRQIDLILPQGEEGENPDMIDLVVQILQEGIEKTKSAKKNGDPALRLEKHLIRMFERFGRFEEAGAVWEELSTNRSTSYAVWYGQADFEMRMGNLKTAHEIYVKGCSAKGLDYPEYLLEAWLAFEKQNGNLADLEFATAKIKRQKAGLERKRYREAMAAAAAAPQVAAAAPEATPVASTSTASDADAFIAEAVQSTDDAGKKRERSPPTGEEPVTKKVKFEQPVAPTETAPEEVKRDRENSTVFVISPSAETEWTEDELKKFFKDCGEFREVKIKTIGDQQLAMIEFMERDNVLAAQTKDKKKINGVEVDVHVAWQSCLYVTNFPESYDKEKMETLFSQFGIIFDSRWPSKRYKSTRRFCYIQFPTPTSAQAALSLHNTELEGLKLSVLVSDPGRKKGRTDAGANDRELYVAGLSKFVKEQDLKKLFEVHGAIKGIRLGLDDKGECKGFAFVEFEKESSAQASLVLNNHELKKRHMSVTIAQHRAKGTQSSIDSTNNTRGERSGESKANLLSRSVRVRGLVPGTEEAIVQQAFSKFANVKLVILEAGATDAMVELENAAEAGKILMQKDSITVDGHPVEIFADGAQARTPGGARPAASKGASEAPLLPRQASRGRGRVGLRGGRGGAGRGGIGSVARGGGSVGGQGGAGASAQPKEGKSQDDFRALFAKKD